MLGERLKKLRESRGWSQAQLADKIDVSDMTISSYESNLRVPPFKNLMKICEVFNVDLNYLAGINPLSDLPMSDMNVQVVMSKMRKATPAQLDTLRKLAEAVINEDLDQ